MQLVTDSIPGTVSCKHHRPLQVWEQHVCEMMSRKMMMSDCLSSGFDNVILSIAANSTYSTNLRWGIYQSLWSFKTHSPFDWFTRLGNIKWTPELVKNLTMPVFIAKGQDDNATLQAPELAQQMLTTGRPNGARLTTYHQFNTSLGAGEHCASGAESQQGAVVVDWLSNVWGGMAWSSINS